MRRFTERILLAALFSLLFAFNAIAGNAGGEFHARGELPYLADTVDSNIFDETDFNLVESIPIMKMPAHIQIGCMLIFYLEKDSRPQGQLAVGVKLGAKGCPGKGMET